IEVATTALQRLGFHHAAATLQPAFEQAEVKYFSLDLGAGSTARVKVYFVHQDATPAALAQLFSIAPTHQNGDVIQFCKRMTGDRGRFDRKALSSCFAFVGGEALPSGVTLHLPI